MDSAYDAPEIRAASRALGHVPIIDSHPRAIPGGERELAAEARRRRLVGHRSAEDVRYNERGGDRSLHRARGRAEIRTERSAGTKPRRQKSKISKIRRELPQPPETSRLSPGTFARGSTVPRCHDGGAGAVSAEFTTAQISLMLNGLLTTSWTRASRLWARARSEAYPVINTILRSG